MKKFILLLMILLITIAATACTFTDNLNFDFKYDNETQSCTLKNISDDDYEKLKITILLQGKDGFEKEIIEEIEKLKQGQEYKFKLKGISEETELENVVLKSYDYHVDILGVIFLILAIIGIVIIAYL